MTGIFLEAAQADAAGGKFRVRVIRAGLSGNGTFYPDAVLSKSVRLFEGARVLVKGDREHLAGGGKDFRNIVGKISRVSFVAGPAPDTGELQADMVMIEPNGEIATKLREANARGMSDLFGLSIDAVGAAKSARIDGRDVRVMSSFAKVNSVDLIVEPSAGGQVLNLIESVGSRTMEFLSKMTIADVIKASGLPAKTQSRLQTKYGNSEELTEETLREALADVRALASDFSETGKVQMGGFPRIEMGETRAGKFDLAFDALLDPTHKDHRHSPSIRDLYVAATGDRGITGLIGNCDEALMRESLNSGSFTSVLGNSITRRLIAIYNRPNVYDVWRKVASVTTIRDFRTNERTRFGGYGDLPIVAEGGPYIAQTSPTDEKATYAAQKRGGTEDLTLEMIANDDVGAVQRIPQNMANAAKRTLSKFVMDFLRTNPTIYDSIALFHASHGNLGTSALDATQMAAARLSIMKQTEMNSADRLGIPPAWLAVPLDVEEPAVNLFNRNTNNDKTFVQAMTLEILPVWYWVDTNDWVAGCDPTQIPTIEIGFLNGNQEPELFVQDMATVGSMFSNDRVTYKIRHIYGGTVLDFRGLFKAVVA